MDCRAAQKLCLTNTLLYSFLHTQSRLRSKLRQAQQIFNIFLLLSRNQLDDKEKLGGKISDEDKETISEAVKKALDLTKCAASRAASQRADLTQYAFIG